MKKIIIVKSAEESPASAVLIGPELDAMKMVMAVSDMKEDIGWTNLLHDKILDQEFVVLPTVIKNVSMAQDKHSKVWKEKRSNFKAKEFANDLFSLMIEDVDRQFNLNKEISEMTGDEGQVTEMVNMRHFRGALGKLSNRYTSLNELMEIEGFSNTVWKFENHDNDTWKKSWGWCIYNPLTSQLTITYSPEILLQTIAGQKVLYVDRIGTTDAIKNNNINNTTHEIMEKKLNESINKMETWTDSDHSKLQDIFSL